ncbi:MAG: DEAD/DEAH box helicase [Thermoanaerobaculia bacterium]|nr:DEAD/DEAH box helicase [Thermoanaerobaculia bacterium]
MPLTAFDPTVRAWFEERLGAPTEIQRRAWPEIAAGRHLLLTAPTGSGKTLAACLWALDRLATGAWEAGRVRLVYVSPLKALNYDVERNLARPLQELEHRFEAAGRAWPGPRLGVRTGDTPPAERRRLLRTPPEILITTPESLNLLLNAKAARGLFDGLAAVVLDEIHAVAGSRRGVHLMSAVERLACEVGEFQRIALSATVRPLAAVAALVGGFRKRGHGREASFAARDVRRVEAPVAKRYDLEVRAFEEEEGGLAGERWQRMAAVLAGELAGARSTLDFANSRRQAERLARLVNETAGREVAWAHHGSLSREIRSEVEGRLKRGELPAVVATSSLELGIDVGDLDQVVLTGTPPSLSSAVQRVGRAGHGVGQVSRGRFYALHGRDLVHAAVAARAIRDQRVEPLRPMGAPLDLLAQVLLAMVARAPWEIEELFATVRTVAPFQTLRRSRFDLVLEMLAGRYADARIPELRPRVGIDGVTGTVTARPGAARLVAQAGGTIPERGYFQLRVEGTRARLGELDEGFVWERRPGDVFLLGAQAWRIRQIGQGEVLVAPAARTAGAIPPFWRADHPDRDRHFSDAILDFLDELGGRLAGGAMAAPALREWLGEGHALGAEAANRLLAFAREQVAATGALPGRHRILAERVAEERGREGEGRVRWFLHTCWGGRLNRPLALALAARWEESGGGPLEVAQDDDSLLLVGPVGLDAAALLEGLDPERLEALLRARLERSGFFGARFRECAGRALLLPRAAPGQRTPLWLLRQRAKELLAAVASHGDFPVVLEAWRTCLEEEFDLEALRERLGELADGRIRLASCRTLAPSPFARGLVWRQTNELMYEDDVPTATGAALRGGLLEELALDARARPLLAPGLAESFRAKALRVAPGYPPQSAEELLFWVQERVLVPRDEWVDLCAAIDRDLPGELSRWIAELGPRLADLPEGPGIEPAVVAADRIGRLARALARPGLPPREAGEAGSREEGARILLEWLRPQGPVTAARTRSALGLSPGELDELADPLVAEGRLVRGAVTSGAGEEELCHPESLTTLLRWHRTASRPTFAPLPLERLPLLLACQQGLLPTGDGIEGLQERLESLFALPLPAALWETELLPARLRPYFPAWLDALLEESDLVWIGQPRERLAFLFPDEIGLLGSRQPLEGIEGGAGGPAVLPDPGTAREVGELAARAGVPVGDAAATLWAAAWRGEVTNDTFAAVRRARAGAPPGPAGEPPERSGPGRRRSVDRWRRPARSHPGRWRRLAWPAAGGPDGADPLGAEELARERARLLLRRYGVVFRELLAAEAPAFSWRRVARALARLELAGEAVGGQFFSGVPGLQFASPQALRLLQEGLPPDGVFWLSAADPASPCGLDLPGLGEGLPRRDRSGHLVFLGARAALLSRRSGRELEIRLPPVHPRLAELWEPLRVRLARAADPERAIDVERINGEPAAGSPYAARLAEVFALTREGGGAVRLRRAY